MKSNKSQGYLVEKHFQSKLKDPKFRHLYELESKKVNLGFALHRLRTQHGYTQAELAARVGVTQGYIARLETAEASNYEINTLKKIVNALDTILFIGFAEPTKDTHSLEVQQLVRC